MKKILTLATGKNVKYVRAFVKNRQETIICCYAAIGTKQILPRFFMKYHAVIYGLTRLAEYNGHKCARDLYQ